MGCLRKFQFSLDGLIIFIIITFMKSCLAMVIILIIFAAFLGTVAVMYFASSSTEIESTN